MFYLFIDDARSYCKQSIINIVLNFPAHDTTMKKYKVGSITLQRCSLITARKRSLRRLCFYRCLSFCPQGGACVVAQGGMRGCSGGGGVCVVAPGVVHGCSGGD